MINRLTTTLYTGLLLAAVLFATASAADRTSTYQLPNGMQIILKEQHASPMIASVLFVRSGSSYESPYENGITHFLEHLLFDGTATLSREELDRSIQDLGGYINAFTRKDLTAFLVLLPREYITYGLTVQKDMLFYSAFPDQEIPKERQVVIEEINRDADSPDAPAEEFFTQRAYAGTRYERPVLGYKAFIENIPRAAIIDYWKRYYTPSNMTLLIIGDFSSDSMTATIQNTFGTISDNPVRPRSSDSSITRDPLKGTQEFDTVAAVTSAYVDFSIAAPRWDDSMYLPMDLLARYLALDDVSPLMKALKGPQPLASEVNVSLVPYSEFSRLEIKIVTDQPANVDSIVQTTQRELQRLAEATLDTEAVAGIKIQARSEDIFNSERLHYYGFMIAPYLMTAGWEFVQHYVDRLEQVNWSQCQMAAQRWLVDPKHVVTTIRPPKDSTAGLFHPSGLTPEQITSFFDTASFPSYDLLTGKHLVYPSTDSTRPQLVDRAKYAREQFKYGLTVVIKSDSGSRVFAITALGKNRSASESEDKAGITDFVNHCLERGTRSRSAADLTRELAGIGATLTLYDNPWIPYDDRYTTAQYAFAKLETIDSYAKRGLTLLADMLMSPAFDSTEVEKVRGEMMGMLGRLKTSPGSTAKELFYRTLFAGQAYDKPISGTMASIRSITVDDLRSHHHKFYSPGNMVLAIATNLPAAEVMSWVKESLGTMTPGDSSITAAQAPAAPTSVQSVHAELDKAQVAIYLGNLMPGVGDSSSVALEVAAGILSDRLYSNLRERQGLAYSVGAGVQFDPTFGWYYCSMGTSPDKYKQALDGITLEIDKLRLDGASQSEVNRTRNQLWGQVMRAKLSRINQTYYMAVDEYLHRPPGFDASYVRQLDAVGPEAVQKAAARYFRTDAYVLATAGKKPADEAGK